MVNTQLIEKDLRYIWHPCSQMKDYETFPPLEIEQAQGLYLYTRSGQKIIDAISSWWCKSLGHGHPKILEAVQKQLKQYEHVIGTNTCQKPLVELSELLCELIPHASKAFYTGDGSCAVEVALKMALHAQQLKGQTQRTQFLALKNGYHGETALTLSISDLGLYKSPYHAITQDYPMIEPIYVQSTRDPLWHDCSALWPEYEKTLSQHQEQLAAIIFEPLIQGAGGMLMYSADFLKRLCDWASKHQIYVIADEIMTGIGRTGTWLACEHAQVKPDLICLSKGLTSGFCAFSVVLTHDEMFEIFYDDYEKNKNFLHSQTYSGNALGATAALATLKTIQSEQLLTRVNHIAHCMQNHMLDLQETGLVHSVRGLGSVIACDINTEQPRLGFNVFQKALKLGLFLRPLGNTLYWLPPYITEEETLRHITELTHDAILKVRAA